MCAPTLSRVVAVAPFLIAAGIQNKISRLWLRIARRGDAAPRRGFPHVTAVQVGDSFDELASICIRHATHAETARAPGREGPSARFPDVLQWGSPSANCSRLVERPSGVPRRGSGCFGLYHWGGIGIALSTPNSCSQMSDLNQGFDA